jgi:hypothetical protein
MTKKILATFLFALAMTVTAPVASADADMPGCYPCDTK